MSSTALYCATTLLSVSSTIDGSTRVAYSVPSFRYTSTSMFGSGCERMRRSMAIIWRSREPLVLLKL